MRKVAFQVFIFYILAFLTLSVSLFADTIQGSAGAGWQTWTTSDLNQGGTPFWDQSSWDGNQMNIGYCLTGTGGCAGKLSTAPGPLPFWGQTYSSQTKFGGGTDPNIIFTSDGSGNSAQVGLTLAGNAAFNQFGWVSTNANGVINGPLHVLFNGASPGTSTVFSPTPDYAIFLIGKNGDIFYSVSGQNINDPGNQHFAVFNGGNGSTWIGAEDLSFPGTDGDYQDFVVHISPTPEPASLALFGTGLIGLACFIGKGMENQRKAELSSAK